MTSLIYYITGVITGAGALSAWKQWRHIMYLRHLEAQLLAALHEQLVVDNLIKNRTESDSSAGQAPN